MTSKNGSNGTERHSHDEPETYLVLVRHGLTETTGKILPGRTAGLHLSDKGWDQAKALSKILIEAYPTPLAVYLSPLERAQETARPYLDSLSETIPVITTDELLECDFGDWTGSDLKELYKLEEWGKVQKTPSRFRFPHGESFTEMLGRMVDFEQRIDSEHKGGVVVGFSHADTIKAAVTDAFGMHLDQFQRIQIDTASVSVLGIKNGAARVICMNSTTELPRKVSDLGS